MAIRAFQYRLYPTKAQEQALQVQLDVSRHVYNMALEERKLAWELEGNDRARARKKKLTYIYFLYIYFCHRYPSNSGNTAPIPCIFLKRKPDVCPARDTWFAALPGYARIQDQTAHGTTFWQHVVDQLRSDLPEPEEDGRGGPRHQEGSGPDR